MKSASSSGFARAVEQPDAVEGERLVTGVPEALEVEQRDRPFEIEAGGDHTVRAEVERPYDAVLRQAGFLDGGEQAVERAHRLPDLRCGRDQGCRAALRDDQPVGAELSERLADGVAG